MLVPRLFLLSSLAPASVDAFAAPASHHHICTSAAPSWKSQPLHADATEGDAEASGDGGAAKEHVDDAGLLPSEEAADILNSPAFLKRKVEVLESDIAAMEKEIEEANAVYLAGKEEWGAKFDMLNKESQGIQERLAKQGSAGTEGATVDVAKYILNVLDNYDRAFQAVEAATNEEVEIVDAYKHTYDMILDAFADLNVTKVATVGTEFDYEAHQAMMQMPSDEYEEGIVCQEFAPGWRCGETLIRPAMVVVAV